MSGATPWWWPEVTDSAWIKSIKEDYDCAGMDDDEIRNVYAKGLRYAVTWDHIGDAYEHFEPLADSMLKLRAALASIEALGNGRAYDLRDLDMAAIATKALEGGES